MNFVNFLNSDKLFYATSMLTLNAGSRYVVQDLTKLQEKALASTVAKQIILFCMVFVATRDVIMSLCLTFAIIILKQFLLNENSTFCIIPNIVTVPSNNIIINAYSKINSMFSKEKYSQK